MIVYVWMVSVRASHALHACCVEQVGWEIIASCIAENVGRLILIEPIPLPAWQRVSTHPIALRHTEELHVESERINVLHAAIQQHYPLP